MEFGFWVELKFLFLEYLFPRAGRPELAIANSPKMYPRGGRCPRQADSMVFSADAQKGAFCTKNKNIKK